MRQLTCIHCRDLGHHQLKSQSVGTLFVWLMNQITTHYSGNIVERYDRYTDVRIAKKITREEVIEKTIIVPETITREEIVEHIARINEHVYCVAKPIVVEKVVEVPEIEIREKITEDVQKVQQDRYIDVVKVEVQEKIVEVPKYVLRENLVEVVEVDYKDVVVEKIVEVPEIREHVVTKEVSVPQYVEKEVPNYIPNEVEVIIERQLPVPVEAVTTFEYQLAQFRTRVNKVEYPLYVPRFIEVAVAAECFDEAKVAELQHQGAKLAGLTGAQAIGLADVESMATEYQRQNIMNQALIMKRLPHIFSSSGNQYKVAA